MDPDRTILFLPIPAAETGDKKSAINVGDKKSAAESGDKKQAISDRVKVSIIEYLTDNPEGKTSEIAGYLGLSVSRTRNYLKQLVEEGIAEIDGTSNKTRSYRLKR